MEESNVAKPEPLQNVRCRRLPQNDIFRERAISMQQFTISLHFGRVHHASAVRSKPEVRVGFKYATPARRNAAAGAAVV